MAAPLTSEEINEAAQLACLPHEEQKRHYQTIRELALRIEAASDFWDTSEVWCRFHSSLVRSGIWAGLAPRATKVYIALTALADIHTRTTWAGIETVAASCGCGIKTVARAYAELKRKKLISRTRRHIGPYQPYVTYLRAPDNWLYPKETAAKISA